MYTKKFRQGGNITSLDELVKQEFIYVFGRICHRGWFTSWQINYAKRLLSQGWLFYAEKVEGGDNNG